MPAAMKAEPRPKAGANNRRTPSRSPERLGTASLVEHGRSSPSAVDFEAKRPTSASSEHFSSARFVPPVPPRRGFAIQPDFLTVIGRRPAPSSSENRGTVRSDRLRGPSLPKQITSAPTFDWSRPRPGSARYGAPITVPKAYAELDVMGSAVSYSDISPPAQLVLAGPEMVEVMSTSTSVAQWSGAVPAPSVRTSTGPESIIALLLESAFDAVAAAVWERDDAEAMRPFIELFNRLAVRSADSDGRTEYMITADAFCGALPWGEPRNDTRISRCFASAASSGQFVSRERYAETVRELLHMRRANDCEPAFLFRFLDSNGDGMVCANDLIDVVGLGGDSATPTLLCEHIMLSLRGPLSRAEFCATVSARPALLGTLSSLLPPLASAVKGMTSSLMARGVEPLGWDSHLVRAWHYVSERSPSAQLVKSELPVLLSVLYGAGPASWLTLGRRLFDALDGRQGWVGMIPFIDIVEAIGLCLCPRSASESLSERAALLHDMFVRRGQGTDFRALQSEAAALGLSEDELKFLRQLCLSGAAVPRSAFIEALMTRVSILDRFLAGPLLDSMSACTTAIDMACTSVRALAAA